MCLDSPGTDTGFTINDEAATCAMLAKYCTDSMYGEDVRNSSDQKKIQANNPLLILILRFNLCAIRICGSYSARF